MDKIPVKILNLPSENSLDLPSYATKFSSGMDLKANINQDIIIKPFNRIIVPTGIFLEIPENYEIQIRSRSGLAFNHGVIVLNSPGTIDSDYRGEIKVILINLGSEDFLIKHGDRIAQMILSSVRQMNLIEVENLSDSQRNIGGFGSTGIRD